MVLKFYRYPKLSKASIDEKVNLAEGLKKSVKAGIESVKS
jgi:hypothetical protein